ncbi:glycosyltransferase family 2 protein [Anaerosacchariphilus polymeriproducens]|uniref:Glycosyltransferase family 2 protein n=1 Tax=Anaerosacchariphilus polymeriproducens TaxID=1812858 RepID=A0A371ARU3_9FIRM|nr:glycosyltransferase family 2 protein [Anaerosacchariphilus polymeriproducens]RDU22293.1 glycosyltransferase family 2 protein [Anaerosacchariphilus polymeriproducens]
MRSKILIIIPAYNEEANIKRVVDNLIKNYPQYDYVIVNDGSKDRTADICRENHYNLIDLQINLGLAGAFQAGLKYAYHMGYDCAIQYDADGQHRAEYIESLYEEMQKGYDIIIGSRFVTRKRPRSLRMLGNFLISIAMIITTRKSIQDPTSGMRMLNKKMIEEFALNMNYGPEPDTISYLIKSDVKVKEVQVEMDERVAGESYFNFGRSLAYMVRMAISILVIQGFRKRTTSYIQDSEV